MSEALGTLERIADALERIAAALATQAPTLAPPPATTGPTRAQLKLTTRTRNALDREDEWREERGQPRLKTLADIAECTRPELLRMSNFGHVGYIEIWRLCVEHGYWAPDDATRAPDARRLAEVEAKERAGKWRPPQSNAA